MIKFIDGFVGNKVESVITGLKILYVDDKFVNDVPLFFNIVTYGELFAFAIAKYVPDGCHAQLSELGIVIELTSTDESVPLIN